MSRTSRLRTPAAVLAVAMVIVAAYLAVNSVHRTRSLTGTRAMHNVVANLFEWNWPSVAHECTTVLGPKGYGAVQVAPPQDSMKRQHLGDGSDTVLHPWWEVYQPADYQLTSRMGDGQQFRSMVRTCRRAGVKVIVDAVINHMTGQGDTSYGGKHFTKYDYPGIYTSADFHVPAGECPTNGDIADFNNELQVFRCELVSLSDLRTQTTRVRNRLAAYLNTLIGYGVSGFRVDAAKHIGQTDLAAIYRRLHNTVDGARPYWALEVFGGGPGVLAPDAFTGNGTVLGLDADKQLQAAFKSYPDAHVGSIATLRDFGVRSGLPPSNKALVFVQNHDTERNGDALNYKDGARNLLANEFVLAYGYGRPQVYAGFEWQTSDDSPPSDADGMVTDTDCSNGWACIDRNRGVANMVGWHNYVGRAARTHWYDDRANLIAFARGTRGWISLNNGPDARTRTFSTGLPRGTYCDVIHGRRSHGSCTGPSVRVAGDGTAHVTVPSRDAVAIDGASRL